MRLIRNETQDLSCNIISFIWYTMTNMPNKFLIVPIPNEILLCFISFTKIAINYSFLVFSLIFKFIYIIFLNTSCCSDRVLVFINPMVMSAWKKKHASNNFFHNDYSVDFISSQRQSFIIKS